MQQKMAPNPRHDRARCWDGTDLSRAVIRDGDQPGIVVRAPRHARNFRGVSTQPAMRLRQHQWTFRRILCTTTQDQRQKPK